MGKKGRRRLSREDFSFLPHLFTLGNAICGFGAIVKLCMLQVDATGAILNTANLWQAAFLIVCAMVFDALDGHVARFVRTAGDFGGQLDSLSDAVSFGAAPAVAIAMTNSTLVAGTLWGKMAWVCAAVYCCGTLLRLARFNVENAHDDGSHQTFRGLASPGAAGVVAAMLLMIHYLQSPRGDRVGAWLDGLIGGSAAAMILYALPFAGLLLGYLMISRVPYVHPAQRGVAWLRRADRASGGLLRGPSTSTAILVAAVLLLYAWPEITATAIFVGYASSGPLLMIYGAVRRQLVPAPAEPKPSKKSAEVPAARADGSRRDR